MHRACVLQAAGRRSATPGANQARSRPGLPRRRSARPSARRASPAGLLQAIGRVESGRRDPVTGRVAPWPWTINAEGRGMYLPDPGGSDCRGAATPGRAACASIDVGCMQVNLHHHPNAFAYAGAGLRPPDQCPLRGALPDGAAIDPGGLGGAPPATTIPRRPNGPIPTAPACWRPGREEQRRPGGDPAAEAMALAALMPARGRRAAWRERRRPGAHHPATGGRRGGGAGPGLDAYRSAPIMLVGSRARADGRAARPAGGEHPRLRAALSPSSGRPADQAGEFGADRRGVLAEGTAPRRRAARHPTAAPAAARPAPAPSRSAPARA